MAQCLKWNLKPDSPASFVRVLQAYRPLFTCRVGSKPATFETLPRRGYRFLAPVLTAEQQVVSRPSISNEDGRRGIKPSDAILTRGFKVLLSALVLAVLLLSAYFLRRVRPAVPQERTRTMVAVLPFEDLSKDPDQEYFTEGLTEELIAEMGQLNPDQLGVIASVSAMRYKGSDKSVQQIRLCCGAWNERRGSVSLSSWPLLGPGADWGRTAEQRQHRFGFARYTCADVSFGCRKRSIQYAQPNTIGKRMRSTITRTWTLGGGAPLKLSNQSAVNTTMNVQSTR